MTAAASASDVAIEKITFAPEHLRREGLLAWATVRLGGTAFTRGFGVRITTAGDLQITWPMHRSARGRLHPVIEVDDDGFRKKVDDAVLRAFGEAYRKMVGRTS